MGQAKRRREYDPNYGEQRSVCIQRAEIEEVEHLLDASGSLDALKLEGAWFYVMWQVGDANAVLYLTQTERSVQYLTRCYFKSQNCQHIPLSEWKSA